MFSVCTGFALSLCCTLYQKKGYMHNQVMQMRWNQQKYGGGGDDLKHGHKYKDQVVENLNVYCQLISVYFSVMFLKVHTEALERPEWKELCSGSEGLILLFNRLTKYASLTHRYLLLFFKIGSAWQYLAAVTKERENPCSVFWWEWFFTAVLHFLDASSQFQPWWKLWGQ